MQATTDKPEDRLVSATQPATRPATGPADEQDLDRAAVGAMDRARAHAVRGQWEQAAAQWRTATETAQQSDRPELWQETFVGRAEFLINRGDLAQAQVILRRLLARADQAGWKQPAGFASLLLGRLLRDSGRPDEAAPLLQRALDFGSAAALPATEHMAAMELAELQFARQQYDAVAKLLDIAERAAQGAADPLIPLSTQLLRLRLLIQQRQFDQAEALSRRTADAALAARKPAVAADAHTLRARVAELRQDPKEMEAALRLALSLVEEGGGRPAAIAAHRLGFFLAQHGKAEEAPPLLRRALEALEPQERPPALAAIYDDQARIYLAIGRSADAEALARKLAELATREKLPLFRVKAHLVLGVLAARQQHPDQVQTLLRQVLPDARGLGDRIETADVQVQLACAAFARQQFAAAAEAALAALSIHERLGEHAAATTDSALLNDCFGAVDLQSACADQLEQLHAEHQKAGRRLAAARAARLRALLAWSRSDFPAIETWARKALAVIGTPADPPEAAEAIELGLCQSVLAGALSHQKRYDEAIRTALASLKSLSGRVPPAYLAGVHGTLADAYAATGKTAQARAAAQEVVKLLRDSPDPAARRRAVQALLFLYQAHRQAKEFAPALEAATRAAEIVALAGEPARAFQIHLDAARYCLEQRQGAAGLKAIAAAEPLLPKVPEPLAPIWLDSVAARLAELAGDFPAARQRYQRCIEAAAKLKQYEGEARERLAYGDALARQKLLVDALNARRDALQLAETHGYDGIAADAANNNGWDLLQAGRADDAVPWLERSLAICQRGKLGEHQVRALAGLANAAKTRRDFAAARTYLTQLRDLHQARGETLQVGNVQLQLDALPK